MEAPAWPGRPALTVDRGSGSGCAAHQSADPNGRRAAEHLSGFVQGFGIGFHFASERKDQFAVGIAVSDKNLHFLERLVALKRGLPARESRTKITCAMSQRYFLDKSGVKTTRMQNLPGQGHIAIGKDALAEKGIVPKDAAEVYTQMFKLKYVRVVEHDDGRVEVEHTSKLTTHQKRFLKALADAGRTLVTRIDMIPALQPRHNRCLEPPNTSPKKRLASR